MIPTSFLHPLWLHMLKGGLDKRTRDAIGVAAAAWIDQNVPRNAPRIKTSAPPSLYKDGYLQITPKLSAEDIAQVMTYFADTSPPLTDGRFQYYDHQQTHLCPPLAKLIIDTNLADTASAYLGCAPTISIASLWWSHPSDQPIGGMQMWHHDRGDFRSVNLFIYLTEVTPETGPHMYVPGTHESYYGEHGAEFWDWFDQSHRKTDKDVAKHCLPAPVVFCGEPGTSFFEDTRGLHKGLPPLSGPRLCFEICYTVMPKLNEAYDPVDLPGYKPTYVTRLIYK